MSGKSGSASRRTTRTRTSTRVPRTTRAEGAIPEQNVAGEPLTHRRGESPSYNDLRLPHERDENVDPPDPSARKSIERAARDIREGKIDTDSYRVADDAFRRRNWRNGKR
jgi:hypothetical protein